MTEQILTTLGGLGLFLVGMVVMTEGLKAMAGEALHSWLTRFTSSPSSGAVTGTVATAGLQSSSATTVTTVGFVAAINSFTSDPSTRAIKCGMRKSSGPTPRTGERAPWRT